MSSLSSRGRHVDVVAGQDGTVLSWIDGKLFGHDAATLDKWLDAMAIRARSNSAVLMRRGCWRTAVSG